MDTQNIELTPMSMNEIETLEQEKLNAETTLMMAVEAYLKVGTPEEILSIVNGIL